MDDSWSITHQTLLFLAETIPNFGPDLDAYFSMVLPNLIICLGYVYNACVHDSDAKVVVRKSGLRLFSLYLQRTNNVDLALGYYVRNGLENNNVNCICCCITIRSKSDRYYVLHCQECLMN